MDEKEFKKHLADLVHGHHHPDEHDWEQKDGQPPAEGAPGASAAATKPVPEAKRKPPKRAHASRPKPKRASG